MHTNTIEGAFSHFKRMVYGIYHQISPKHTERYCDEFSYRYNSRKMKDADRFNPSFTSVNCRLRYKTLVTAPEPIPYEATKNNYKGIIKMKEGEMLAHYNGFRSASNATGISKSDIRRVCQGKRKTAGGFQWCFA